MATRLIEWVGGKSIFADPLFQYRRIAGLVSPEELRIARTAATRRNYRVPGFTSRVVTKRDGFSREYRWGPHVGDYVQRMGSDDWDLLRSGKSGREFRDITDGIPEPSPIALPGEVVVADEQDFNSLSALLRADRGR